MKSSTHLQLRHLRCIVTVAQQGSLKQAAHALSLTVPAVSKTLSELEDLVGQPLLQRLHSGARLTPAGEVFCRFASASLRNVREAWNAMQPDDALPAHPIHVGALPNVAASVLPQVIDALLGEHPQSRLHVHTGNNTHLLSELAAGRLDMVIGRMGEPSQMVCLTFEHLYSEPLVFISREGHPLLSKKTDLLEELQRTRLIVSMPGTRIRRDADEFFARRGLPMPGHRIESESVQFGLGMILQSDAIWFGPWGMIESAVESQQLKVVPIDTSDSLGPVGLTLRQDQQLSHSCEELLRHLRAVAGQRRQDPWRRWLPKAVKAAT